ncbi:sensor histidine kinase [Listeria valentina]|uniref:sensor histidine kinase n=1 Tax=Listeria valentina TaxID=2705293 RepID=UPI0014308C99|nr:HAMP domain-containing sensor histidine kinase [Listeria valentina]
MKEANRRTPITLFYRNWFTNFISVGLTLFLFFLIMALLLITNIQKQQQEAFKKESEKIFSIYKQQDIAQNIDNMSIKQDYIIFIFKNGKLDYTNLNIKKDPNGNQLTVSSYKNYFNSLNSDYLKYEKTESPYHIFISTINDLSPHAILAISKEVILYGLLLGILVSFVLSAIYSRNLKKQFNELNTFIDSYKTISPDQPSKKRTLISEFQVLEENISEMFRKLDEASRNLESQYQKEQKKQTDRIDFIRGSNHELKTPIMSLRLILEGMLNDFPEYADKPYHMQVAIKKLDDMTSLVNEIMDASRLEIEFTEGKTDLAEAVKNTLEWFEPISLDQNITMDLSKLDREMTINIPDKHLKKVCSNLISNALKYSPSDSTIKIGYRPSRNIFYIKNKINSPVQLDVKEIVRPFHTQDSSENFPSHGLGLFVVDNILAKYDYRYQIVQNPDEFIFMIKLTQNNSF